jgi:hypothetical protein
MKEVPNKKSTKKSLLFIIIIGLCLMTAGSLMGACRSIDINFWGFNAQLNAGFDYNGGRGNRNNQPLNFGATSRDGNWLTVTEHNLPAFTEIHVSLVNMDIELRQSDHFGMELRYYSGSNISWVVNNGRLTIEDRTSNRNSRQINLFSGIGVTAHSGGYAVIYFPAAEHIFVNSVSGDIIADNHGRQMKLATVSGAVKINHAQSDIIALATVSGDVSLHDVTVPTLSMDTVSGNATAVNINSDTISFQTVSGNLRYDTERGQAQYHISKTSISGRLHINGETIPRSEHTGRGGGPYRLNLNSISGNVDLFFGN